MEEGGVSGGLEESAVNIVEQSSSSATGAAAPTTKSSKHKGIRHIASDIARKTFLKKGRAGQQAGDGASRGNGNGVESTGSGPSSSSKKKGMKK